MQNQPDPKKPLLLVKYGGNAMTDNELKMKILKILSGFQKGTFQVVIVHGGGPFIKKILEEAGIKSEFIDGHRKTTHEALEYVEMALKGRVNSDLVGRLNSMDVKAVGLSGRDGQTVTARKREHFSLINGKKVLTDLGQVGDVKSVDTKFLELLTRNNYLPVMSCTAADESGAGYNINADMFAGHIAGALKVDQFIVLTDVDGLMRDKNDPSTLIRELIIAG
jgi:acetylglutamate kinase